MSDPMQVAAGSADAARRSLAPWLGVLFVLSVYYFPTGVVGRLRAAAAH